MIQDLRIAHALLVHSKFRKTFKKEMKNYACNIRARANSKKVALPFYQEMVYWQLCW